MLHRGRGIANAATPCGGTAVPLVAKLPSPTEVGCMTLARKMISFCAAVGHCGAPNASHAAFGFVFALSMRQRLARPSKSCRFDLVELNRIFILTLHVWMGAALGAWL